MNITRLYHCGWLNTCLSLRKSLLSLFVVMSLCALPLLLLNTCSLYLLALPFFLCKRFFGLSVSPILILAILGFSFYPACLSLLRSIHNNDALRTPSPGLFANPSKLDHIRIYGNSRLNELPEYLFRGANATELSMGQYHEPELFQYIKQIPSTLFADAIYARDIKVSWIHDLSTLPVDLFRLAPKTLRTVWIQCLPELTHLPAGIFSYMQPSTYVSHIIRAPCQAIVLLLLLFIVN